MAQLKSNLKNSTTTTEVPAKSSTVQFRIMAGSYEHSLLCVSALLDPSGAKDALFQPIFHFQAHTRSVKNMDIAKRYMVTGSDDEHIRIYDLQKRKELGNLLSHQGSITALKFSCEKDGDEPFSTEKTGKWLLSGSADGKIIIWRSKDWEPLGTLKGHTDRVNDLAIHPSGRVAISVSSDNTIRLWNLLTAKKAAVLKLRGKDHLGQKAEFVRWSLDGSHFYVGLLNTILIYNTASAKIVRKIKFASTLMCFDFFRLDATDFLVSGHGDGTVAFTDVASIDMDDSEAEVKPAFVLRGHSNRVKDLTFYQHPVETSGVPYMMTVSSDGKIVVWNLAKDVRDQIAVYDTGERLNCVAVCSESIEKFDTMKKRYDAVDAEASESEYESDGEVRRVMGKNKKRRVRVTLE